MKIFRDLIGIFVIYSMAFATPAAGASSKTSDFSKIKTYLNSKKKKSYSSLLRQMESSLPSGFYEKAMKNMKGSAGKKFFDFAKINNRYAYFRFNDSKITIRFKTKKGKTVFLANGIKINESDFRDMRVVQGKLMLAYIKGTLSKKRKTRTSFLDLIEWSKAFASTEELFGTSNRFQVN